MSKERIEPKRGHKLPEGSGAFYWSPSRQRWIGSVEAGWSDKGTRRRITVMDKNEDKAWRKFTAKRKQVLEEGVSNAASGKVTVKAWCETMLEVRAAMVKPKTFSGEQSAITKWVIPVLGMVKLEELTPAHIRKLGATVMAGDKKKNTQTHAHYVQRQLRTYLKAAKIEGKRVPDGVLQMSLIPDSTNPREALPLDVAASVLREAHKHAGSTRWDAAFLQGIRQGEALGLTWDRVDFEQNTITIDRVLYELKKKNGTYYAPQQYKATPIWGRFWHLPPKTKAATRTIPMIPAFRQRLLEWREVAPHSDAGLVWPRPNGLPRLPEQDRAEFVALQEAAHVTKGNGKFYTVHEARHTTVSILLGLNVPREVIELIVGQEELVSNYIHVEDARIEAALNKLGAALQICA